MKDHPRYFEILSRIDAYKFCIEERLKFHTQPDKRSGLDRMIDKSTGYDKHLDQLKAKELKMVIIWLKAMIKFARIIDHYDLEATEEILGIVREYREKLK